MSNQDGLLFKVASNVKLFHGIQKQNLIQLLSCANKVTIKDGALFFDEGAYGESFYVLVTGKAAVEKEIDGTWQQVAMLEAGDSFGEMTLVFDEKIRSARIKAVGDCLALYFEGLHLKQIHPNLLSTLFHNIARVIAGRLKATNIELSHVKLKLSKVLGKAEPKADPKADPKMPTKDSHQ